MTVDCPLSPWSHKDIDKLREMISEEIFSPNAVSFEGSDDESLIVVSDIDEFLEEAKQSIQQTLSKDHYSASFKYSEFSRHSTAVENDSVDDGDSTSSSDDDTLLDSMFSESTHSGYHNTESTRSHRHGATTRAKPEAKGFYAPHHTRTYRDVNTVDLKKYLIYDDENSILTHSSMHRQRKTQKQDYEAEKSWENIEHTVDDLTFTLAQQNHPFGHFHSNTRDRKAEIVSRFQDQSRQDKKPAYLAAQTSYSRVQLNRDERSQSETTNFPDNSSKIRTHTRREADDASRLESSSNFDGVSLNANNVASDQENPVDLSKSISNNQKVFRKNDMVVDQMREVTVLSKSRRMIRNSRNKFRKHVERLQTKASEQKSTPPSLTIDSLALCNDELPTIPTTNGDTDSMVSTSVSDSVVSSCETSRRRVTEVRNRRMARLQKMQTVPSREEQLSRHGNDFGPEPQEVSVDSTSNTLEQLGENLTDFLTRPSSADSTPKSPRHRGSTLAPLRHRMADEELKSAQLDTIVTQNQTSFDTPGKSKRKTGKQVIPKLYPGGSKELENFVSPVGLDSRSILKTLAPPSLDAAVKGKGVSRHRSPARVLALTPKSKSVSSDGRSKTSTPATSLDKKSSHDDSFDEIVLRKGISSHQQPLFPQHQVLNPSKENDSFQDLVRQRSGGGKFQSKQAKSKYKSPTSVLGFMPPTQKSQFHKNNVVFGRGQAAARLIDYDDESSAESMIIMDLEVL